MFSSKSLELIRTIERGSFAKKKYMAFKPDLDTRGNKYEIKSRFGSVITAIPLKNLDSIFSIIGKGIDIVAFDEAQFFDPRIVEVCLKLRRSGIHVVIAGLDLDRFERPFGSMGDLMAIANKVVKHSAVCQECGEDAHISFRQTDEKEQIIVGSENYVALCYDCYYFELSKKRVKN